jgi:hypothetical protein
MGVPVGVDVCAVLEEKVRDIEVLVDHGEASATSSTCCPWAGSTADGSARASL